MAVTPGTLAGSDPVPMSPASPRGGPHPQPRRPNNPPVRSITQLKKSIRAVPPGPRRAELKDKLRTGQEYIRQGRTVSWSEDWTPVPLTRSSAAAAVGVAGSPLTAPQQRTSFTGRPPVPFKPEPTDKKLNDLLRAYPNLPPDVALALSGQPLNAEQTRRAADFFMSEYGADRMLLGAEGWRIRHQGNTAFWKNTRTGQRMTSRQADQLLMKYSSQWVPMFSASVRSALTQLDFKTWASMQSPNTDRRGGRGTFGGEMQVEYKKALASATPQRAMLWLRFLMADREMRNTTDFQELAGMATLLSVQSKEAQEAFVKNYTAFLQDTSFTSSFERLGTALAYANAGFSFEELGDYLKSITPDEEQMGYVTAADWLKDPNNHVTYDTISAFEGTELEEDDDQGTYQDKLMKQRLYWALPEAEKRMLADADEAGLAPWEYEEQNPDWVRKYLLEVLAEQAADAGDGRMPGAREKMVSDFIKGFSSNYRQLATALEISGSKEFRELDAKFGMDQTLAGMTLESLGVEWDNKADGLYDLFHAVPGGGQLWEVGRAASTVVKTGAGAAWWALDHTSQTLIHGAQAGVYLAGSTIGNSLQAVFDAVDGDIEFDWAGDMSYALNKTDAILKGHEGFGDTFASDLMNTELWGQRGWSGEQGLANFFGFGLDMTTAIFLDPTNFIFFTPAMRASIHSADGAQDVVKYMLGLAGSKADLGARTEIGARIMSRIRSAENRSELVTWGWDFILRPAGIKTGAARRAFNALDDVGEQEKFMMTLAQQIYHARATRFIDSPILGKIAGVAGILHVGGADRAAKNLNVTPPEYFINQARLASEKGSNYFYEAATKLFRNRLSAGGLPRRFTDKIYDMVTRFDTMFKEGAFGEMTKAEFDEHLRILVRGAMLKGFGIHTADDARYLEDLAKTVHEARAATTLSRARTAEQKAAAALPKAERPAIDLRAARTAARDELRKAPAYNGDWMDPLVGANKQRLQRADELLADFLTNDDPWRGRSIYGGPNRGGVGFASQEINKVPYKPGPIRAARVGVQQSVASTGRGESIIRTVQHMSSALPRLVADIEGDLGTFVEQYMRRADVFTPEEVATWRKQAEAIRARGTFTAQRKGAREKAFIRFMEDLSNEVALRTFQRRNLIVEDMFEQNKKGKWLIKDRSGFGGTQVQYDSLHDAQIAVLDSVWQKSGWSLRRAQTKLNAHLFAIQHEILEAGLKEGEDIVTIIARGRKYIVEGKSYDSIQQAKAAAARIARKNAKAGGAAKAEIRVQTALFETQLPNMWAMFDPQKLSRSIDEAIGYGQRWRSIIERTFKRHLTTPELKEFTQKRMVDVILDDIGTRLVRLWKIGAVATPRYMLRVPLGDEQLRVMADLGFFNWVSTKKLAARLSSTPDRVVMLPVMPGGAELHEAVTRAGLSVDELLDLKRQQRLGLIHPNDVQRLERVPDWVHEIMDTSIDGVELRELSKTWDETFGALMRGENVTPDVFLKANEGSQWDRLRTETRLILEALGMDPKKFGTAVGTIHKQTFENIERMVKAYPEYLEMGYKLDQPIDELIGAFGAEEFSRILIEVISKRASMPKMSGLKTADARKLIMQLEYLGRNVGGSPLQEGTAGWDAFARLAKGIMLEAGIDVKSANIDLAARWLGQTPEFVESTLKNFREMAGYLARPLDSVPEETRKFLTSFNHERVAEILDEAAQEARRNDEFFSPPYIVADDGTSRIDPAYRRKLGDLKILGRELEESGLSVSEKVDRYMAAVDDIVYRLTGDNSFTSKYQLLEDAFIGSPESRQALREQVAREVEAELQARIDEYDELNPVTEAADDAAGVPWQIAGNRADGTVGGTRLADMSVDPEVLSDPIKLDHWLREQVDTDLPVGTVIQVGKSGEVWVVSPVRAADLTLSQKLAHTSDGTIGQVQAIASERRHLLNVERSGDQLLVRDGHHTLFSHLFDENPRAQAALERARSKIVPQGEFDNNFVDQDPELQLEILAAINKKIEKSPLDENKARKLADGVHEINITSKNRTFAYVKDNKAIGHLTIDRETGMAVTWVKPSERNSGAGAALLDELVQKRGINPWDDPDKFDQFVDAQMFTQEGYGALRGAVMRGMLKNSDAEMKVLVRPKNVVLKDGRWMLNTEGEGLKALNPSSDLGKTLPMTRPTTDGASPQIFPGQALVVGMDNELPALDQYADAQRILITGSRGLDDTASAERIEADLASLAKFYESRNMEKPLIILGDAKGVDTIAYRAALKHGFEVKRFDAAWSNPGGRVISIHSAEFDEVNVGGRTLRDLYDEQRAWRDNPKRKEAAARLTKARGERTKFYRENPPDTALDEAIAARIKAAEEEVKAFGDIPHSFIAPIDGLSQELRPGAIPRDWSEEQVNAYWNAWADNLWKNASRFSKDGVDWKRKQLLGLRGKYLISNHHLDDEARFNPAPFINAVLDRLTAEEGIYTKFNKMVEAAGINPRSLDVTDFMKLLGPPGSVIDMDKVIKTLKSGKWTPDMNPVSKVIYEKIRELQDLERSILDAGGSVSGSTRTTVVSYKDKAHKKRILSGDSNYAYVGRNPQKFGIPPTMMGGRGEFGNASYFGQEIADKQRAKDAFERYFKQRIAKDPEFKAEVEKLRGRALVCFDKPGVEPCHADVIADYLNETAPAITESQRLNALRQEVGELLRAHRISVSPGFVAANGYGRDAIKVPPTDAAEKLVRLLEDDWGYYTDLRYWPGAGMVRNAEMNGIGNPSMAIGYWDGASAGTRAQLQLEKNSGVPTILRVPAESENTSVMKWQQLKSSKIAEDRAARMQIFGFFDVRDGTIKINREAFKTEDWRTMPFLLEPGKRFDQVGNLRSYRPETLVVWHEEGHAFYFRMSGRHQKRWMNALAEYAQAGNKHVNDFDAAELFADAYMLYRADPEELQKLSPHIYDVFNKQPKQMKKTMEDVIANTQVEYVSKYDMKNGKGQSTSPEDMHVAWNVKDRSGMDPDEIKVNSSSPTEFTSAIIHERADKAGLFDNEEAMDLERLNWESIDPLDMARRAASRGASREQALAELQTYYLPQWYRALVHWHSYSAVGKEVLEMISAGRQTDDMVAFVYDFLRKNREGIAARLGLRGEEEILDHAQLAVNEIVKTTMGDRQIADVALNNPENLQAVLSEKVANLDPKLLPVVNGQLPQQIEGKGPAFLSGIAKKYTETLFATTTNKMSRQPYYKYRRARHERALMGNQLVNGGSWTPSVERAVKMASRENAIADTWELLFDARRQNRLSEMVRFIMPFAQPWSEALVVWSRMLQKNPEFALHLYQIGRTMKDHGVVRQDRMGEWVIKVPFVGDWMATLGNWILPGQIKETNDHFNLVFPLQSFNFMLSSTVNVDGLPVPVPSTWAPATWFAQKLSENDHLPEGLKTMLAEYSYQYGSVQNGGGMVRALLPSWMGSFLSSIGAIGSQKDLYTQDFLQIMEMNGITGISLVEDREMALAMAGRVFNNVEEANIWLIEEAGQKAESFGLMRTFFGSIFPAPPILQMPIYEAQEYLDELKKQYPDDFDVVREKFIEKYPDLKMVAIAATMWDRPDISPVSLPPSSAVAKLFESGAADELMSINPAFLFALLPEEAWDSEFDRIEWMRQIDAGWRRVKTPEEFIASYETSEGWRHFFYATQMRDSKLAALQAQGISSSDPQWDATIEEYDNAIDYMKVLFPAWANDFTPGVEKPATIIANISQALEIPEFANTKVGQGLADYMEFRNGIGNQLEALNISSLDNSVAESLGIKQEYDTYVDGLKEDYGDTFQIFFDRFLGDDLTESYLLTRGEKVLHALSQDVELWNRSIDEQDQWNVLQDRIKDFEPGTDPDYTAVAQLYQEQRNISNDWWKKYGATVDNAQWAWWETRSYSEKQDYLLAIASRPYQYLSRFDKEVILGITTDDLTEEQWANVNYISANAAIANEVNPAGRDAGYWYERADRLAGEYAAANTGFGRELALANTWGYTFFTATGYGGKGTASDPAWRSVQNLVQRYQQFAEAWKMGDDNNYDGFLRRMYIGLRTDLLTAMDNLAQSNPMFAKEYQEMRENYPSFIDVLIPETYYRLG